MYRSFLEAKSYSTKFWDYIWTSADCPCRLQVWGQIWPDGMLSWTEELKSQVIDMWEWETCWGHDTAHIQTPIIQHSLTPLQDSYYIWTSVDCPCRFGVRSDPDGLLSWTEELKSQGICVRDLFRAWQWHIFASVTHEGFFSWVPAGRQNPT